MMSKNTGRSKDGFSLFELLIVIAIMGIVSAIIVPVFMKSIPRYHARAEARKLMIQFKKAKLAAAKYNRNVCIDFINVGGANGRYQVFVNFDRVGPPREYNEVDGDIMLADEQLHRSVQFQSTTFTNSQAGYSPRGLPLQGLNQNVVLGNGIAGDRSYMLTVSLTGNVSIQ